MKLSKAPNMRTVIIAVLAFILIGTAADAFARELRVFTEPDLRACAAGLPLATGPDAGLASAPGDVCVVMPGTYPLAAPLVVTLENLTIRSSGGANVTQILSGFALPIVILQSGVTFGGPQADQGFTISGAVLTPAILIVPFGPLTPDENITIQNNKFYLNLGAAILVPPALNTSVEQYKISNNTFQLNLAGIVIANTGGVGRRGQDRNVVFEKNNFDTNIFSHLAFLNTGAVEQMAILKNTMVNFSIPAGILFANGGEVRDTLISGNSIQFTLGFGMLFANGSRVSDVIIKDNKGPTNDVGISRNLLGGIYFIPPVTELRDVTFDGNVISYNAFGFIFGAGVGIVAVPGDVEGLVVTNNHMRNNCGTGFLKFFGNGDFIRSNFANNHFNNNGNNLPGWAAMPCFVTFQSGVAVLNLTGNIEDNTFTNNEYRENFGNGLSMLTLGIVNSGDISRNTFTGDKAIKNTFSGFLYVDFFGDIAQVAHSNVEALENGAIFAPGIFGSGALMATVTGDIEAIDITSSKYNNNGAFGLFIASNRFGITPFKGDIDEINISNSEFKFNGTRAPVGLGSGLLIDADSVRGVQVLQSVAIDNNDHGATLTASRDLSDITITGGEYSGNDRNRDTIGNGIDISVNESASNISITNVAKINSNNSGIRISAQDRVGRNYTISKNAEINNNRLAGVDLFSGRDLDSVTVSENGIRGNAVGVRIESIDRGANITVTKNSIYGSDGTGTGIYLNSSGVSITENSVRNNNVGVDVRKVRSNSITRNNIARNEGFGMDASNLAPGESIDAANNWWGEPSGPKHASNPGGIGDRVSDKVNFMPFLTEPAFATAAVFQIESLTASDNDVTVGDSVTFSYKIKNNGTEEDTQTVTITIKDGLGNVVNELSRQVTVNPAGFREDQFSYIFQAAGTYTITVSTPDDSKSVTVTVAGESACLPFALDINKNKVLDDAEIITAIDLWVRNGDVPGCSPPQKISDTKIIQLIDLWVKQSQLTVPLGGSKMTAQGATLGVAGFATLNASVRTVRPGESFTVTVQLNASEGINGLLVAQQLPAGWTARPIELSGAYFKASETKWLWLSAKGTVSVSYEVTVPATAQPGLYTIAGRVKAAVPSVEAELAPMTVEVLGAPVALAVKAITLSQRPVRNSGAYFVVEGAGIAQTTVHVFSLTGKLVYTASAQGNVVAFTAASDLANGVYLYVVTVAGADGQTVRSKIEKLVVLK